MPDPPRSGVFLPGRDRRIPRGAPVEVAQEQARVILRCVGKDAKSSIQ